MTLRCIHRHTAKTHPNCFRNGLIKRKDWWKRKKIAYLDIEASDLRANWGHMLSWSIKYRNDNNIRHDIITKEEFYDFSFDRRILETLLEELKNVDIVVTYYGTRFDIPFIRTRSDFYGLEFPKYGSIYHWDLYYKVRRLYKLHRNSLSVATKFFGIEGKTPVSGDVWMKAKYGDPESLEYVLEHNDEDVIILEELHNKLWRYSKWIRKSI